MCLALGVAAAAAVRGEGLPEYGLADLFVAVAGEPLVEVGRARLLGVHELDRRPVRENARRVRADLREGLHEGPLVVLARARLILAQAERHPVDLAERDPVLEGVVLEQVHPGDHAEDSGAGRVPAAGLVAVEDEFVLRELHPLGSLVRSDLEGVLTVPKETLLIAGADVAHDDVTALIGPHNFRDGEALPDRVQEVEHDVPEPLDAVDLCLDELRDLLVPLVVGVEGDDLEVQARDRVLPGLELTEQVGVFLLHLLKELRLPEDVARVGLLEYLGEPDGGEAVRGVVAVFVRYLGDGDFPRVRAMQRGRLPPLLLPSLVLA